MEMSFVEVSLCIVKYQNGARKNLYKEFHSYYCSLLYSVGLSRPILGCRVLVYRSFSKILPALLKDIIDWTVNSRIKSSQLLVTLLFHLEEQMTHHLQGIMRALYRASQDEETVVANEAIKATQLIGMMILIETTCPIKTL